LLNRGPAPRARWPGKTRPSNLGRSDSSLALGRNLVQYPAQRQWGARSPRGTAPREGMRQRLTAAAYQDGLTSADCAARSSALACSHELPDSLIAPDGGGSSGAPVRAAAPLTRRTASVGETRLAGFRGSMLRAAERAGAGSADSCRLTGWTPPRVISFMDCGFFTACLLRRANKLSALYHRVPNTAI